MVNANKAKGAAFERQICDYINEAGIPAERLPAGATLDRGDLWLPHATVQAKNRRELRISTWLEETQIQQLHAGKDWHWLVVKRVGLGDPAKQMAVCTTAQMRRLLELTLP